MRPTYTVVFLSKFLAIVLTFGGVQTMPLNDDADYNSYQSEREIDLDQEDYYPDLGPVQPGFYRCPGGEYSIEVKYLCDGQPDCMDGTDENPDTCIAYSQSTTDSAAPAYVSPPLVLPSDKFDVDSYDYGGCEDDSTMFQCPWPEGFCIPVIALCDGVTDCQNGEDELYCGTNTDENLKVSSLSPSSTSGSLRVTEVTTRPTTTESQHTTELIGTTPEKGTIVTDPMTTAEITTSLGNPSAHQSTEAETFSAVDSNQSTVTTQPTTSDTNLPTTEGVPSTSCLSADEFECRSNPGDCVPRALLCDGYNDCTDGSDEIECDCNENEFQCVSGLCISAIYRCDGYNDCGDYSDEIIDCPNFPPVGKQRSIAPVQTSSVEPYTIIPVTSIESNPIKAPKTTSEPTLSDNFTTAKPKKCQHNICKNDGTCYLNKSVQFFCVCPKGFSGTLCEIPDDCKGEENCKTPRSSGNNLRMRSELLVFLISNLLILITNAFL